MDANARRPRRRVDGILLVDKPPGISSNAALQRVRRLFEAAKAGHGGTLDPLATGLLPVCFGEATKFAQMLLDARKRYRATIRFGEATATGDAEGQVTARAPVAFDGGALEATLVRFTGAIDQQPPRYSALKRDGRPYYAYARSGVEIERTPRRVEIHRLQLVAWDAPDAIIDIECSKGTYVRTLAEDIALALGSCAHLVALRRTGSGPFSIEASHALEALEAMDAAARDARLLPPEAALDAMPMIRVDAAGAIALRHGRRPRDASPPGRYRAYGPQGFIGVVDATGEELRVARLLATGSDDEAP